MEELKATHPAEAESETTPRPARSSAPHPRASRRRRIHSVYVRLSRTMHRTVLSVLAHDCLNMAQSTAYSAIVALFPTLIVTAAVIGLLPDTTPLRFQLAVFFDRILPASVNSLLDVYFQNTPSNTHTVRALVGAGFVSFLGASNVMVTLMEGLRRARNLPPDCWTFWQRRRRGFELVFLSLVPLAVASLLVMFGHAVTAWLAASISPDVRESIYAVALLVRWSVSLGASVGLIALIYRLGVPGKFGVHRYLARKQSSLSPIEASILTPQSWIPILPGAVVATAMWFLTTLAFGWYVTKFANYSEVYGSLGAGIALLFWLYIISLSVLCGAEFNAQFHAHFGEESGHISPPGDARSAKPI